MDVPLEAVAVLLVCLPLTALFSASETALATLGTASLTQMAQEAREQRRTHRLIELWLERRSRAIAALVLGGTLLNALAIVSVVRIIDAAAPFGGWPVHLVAGAIGALLVVVFGKLLPRALAQQHPERVVEAARLLYAWNVLASGPARLLAWASDWVGRRSGAVEPTTEPLVTRDELIHQVQRALDLGKLESDEARVLDSVLRLEGTVVHDVMKPRTEVVGIPVAATLSEILHIMEQTRLTRYPVFREDLDTVVGFLHARDVSGHIVRSGEGRSAFDVQKHLRQPLFVPESKPALEVLRELQRHRVHLAIVVDEFGGTAGLVTVEDIVEEVFGEIYDEHDRAKVGEDLVRSTGDGSWEVEAKVSIIDLEEALDLDIFPDDEEYSTVGGFILSEVGRIPEPGAEVALGGYRFRVLEADTKRVIRVSVQRLAEPAVSPAPG